MQNNCTIKFLHGAKTDLRKIAEIEAGVAVAEELQVEIWLYKKDGKCTIFLDSFVIRNFTETN